jgi:hypothetical protein
MCVERRAVEPALLPWLRAVALLSQLYDNLRRTKHSGGHTPVIKLL